MAARNRKATVVIDKEGERTTAESPLLHGRIKIVIVINNQFTDSPNTTQIASGAGRSSAAGNNAALDSSNTLQQQAVGAGGEAENMGMDGKQTGPHVKHHVDDEDEDAIVIVINNQINQTGEEQGSATQVASGGGTFSAAGTNSAIESSNTKQQHAVGGAEGARAENEGMNDDQQEV